MEYQLVKNFASIALVLAVAAAPQSGHAFTATNGLTVAPVNNVVFEVNDARGAPSQAYWCAAANYAKRKLKAGWQDELYVARTMGHSETSDRPNAVQFTIDPGAAGVTPAGPGSSIDSFVVGDHMKLQKSNGFCR